jgi:hypothetical protein
MSFGRMYTLCFGKFSLGDLHLLRFAIDVDELVQGCRPGCELDHSKDGNCLVCGGNWGDHNGHTCPKTRGIGSWRVLQAKVGPITVHTILSFYVFIFSDMSSPVAVQPSNLALGLKPVSRISACFE